ncbi:Protein Red [Madurella mycetomatis]|uniref:Protein Red n=1 Tax=Madurella mycetomatis TaxID=100816 RepID=A0A175W161_9PEZI|nr:Protein Red [Madurella mycetomatis]
MNNEQFRRLMLANSAKVDSDKNGVSPPSSSPASSTPVALGSRLKSSIPMTPRSVAGGARVDFARQLAERNKAFEKTQKKIRTSAPKGSKLAEGYVDRAKARQQEEEDERAARLEALEESFKKEEIDRETYDRLRGEIAGGDLSSTHLVKGLDFKLLERIRRGEDVYGEKPETPEAAEEEQQAEAEDSDDALEQLESTEVKAIAREKTQKKGQFATTSLNPGQKRSRNQILAELKAARAAAKAKEEASLGSRFKKIGEKKMPGTRIERDSKGREVMIIVDEDGHERRKVRKLDPKAAEELEKEKTALASGKVLGMEVPEFYRKQQEAQGAEEDEKEVNIFDDAGSDYNPLADLEGSDDSSDEEDKTKETPEKKTPTEDAASADMPPPSKPEGPAPRNYFKDSKTGLTSEETYKTPSLDDPAFLAALRKAKAVNALEKSEEEQKAAEREERLKKKLSEISRDDQDLDLGFGSSRVEDEADLDETKVKLSAWGEDDDDGEGGGGAKSKRKRGSKKRKGIRITLRM